MQLEARPAGPLSGRVRAPGDKSMSHRALILGAMAHGVTEIRGLLTGDDVRHTAAACAMFGARIEESAAVWRVTGAGRLAQPAQTIYCGNSGTGVRLLMGAAAGYPITTGFDGDSSLRGRPMQRVLTPLTQMGARILAGAGRLPLTLAGGGLHAIAYKLPVASAQVKSAVILAALNAAGETEIREPERTRDHTERMLTAFGAPLDIEADGVGRRIRVRGGAQLQAAHIDIPGDPSSAAFPIVAALVTPGSEVRVDNVLLNPLRTGLFETLREMGARLDIENERDAAGERVGDIVARHSPLRGVVVPPERAPSMIDEYPILAVAAAFAEGETIMRGIGEMRVKESDRIALTVAGLRACGVRAAEEPDAMLVRGAGAAPPGGAAIATYGDHRIAMAHLVLGCAARAPVRVDEAGMIDTSFPGFAALMRTLRADIA